MVFLHGFAALIAAAALAAAPAAALPAALRTNNLAAAAADSTSDTAAATGSVIIPVSKNISSSGHNTAQVMNLWAARMNNVARRQNGALTNINDELYTAAVTLGGTTFAIDLDTGSADIWFRGANCKSTDTSCGQNGQAAASTTGLTATGKTWTTTYGSGAVAGNVFTGAVTLGGTTATVALGVSTQEVGFTQMDGLLGLAFPTISNIATAIAGAGVTASTSFITAAGLSNSVFSFYLSNTADGTTGEVTLGGTDTTKYTGTLNYVALNSQTYWQASLTGITYTANGATGNLGSTVTNFIADTGTTLMILDSTTAAAINKQVGGTFSAADGVYTCSCSLATTGPDVTITINNVAYTIPPSIYVLQETGTCFTGFTSGADSFGLAILGDVFIRAVYTVFDMGNSQLGFAQAVHGTAAATAATAATTTTAAAATTTAAATAATTTATAKTATTTTATAKTATTAAAATTTAATAATTAAAAATVTAYTTIVATVVATVTVTA